MHIQSAISEVRYDFALWVIITNSNKFHLTPVILKAGSVLEAVLFRGELPRGDVAAILGDSERQTRRTTSALLKRVF